MDRRDFIKYGTVLAGVGGACLLCKNGGVIFKGKPADIKSFQMDTRPCKIPFECLEIHPDGNVYTCCPDFIKGRVPVGNIKEQGYNEIWNGEKLNDFRQKILKGDFSMCNRDICCCYKPCSKDDIPSDYKKGPQEIKICYDFECNYNCITCRDEIKINTPEEMKLYDEVYLPKVVEIAKNAKIVTLSLSGDALFSRHTRKLMRTIAGKYPDIKFYLHTNGYLLDEENLTELGIKDNILWIDVSVDSVKRETYKKILRADGFDRVIKNLELMAEWKKQGKIERITINFVVHLMNYKEMPEFVKLAQRLDAVAFFSAYRPWTSAEYYRLYNEVAVFEPTNKHYKEFVKILKNPIFQDKDHCFLEARLADIAKL